MQKNESRLTVFFEAPFWVAVYERVTDGRMEVCKITFGAEPKDYEVHEFLLKNWNQLRFSPPVVAEENQDKKMNPKRRQKAVKKHLMSHGTGTKSQQALKLQKEENKTARKEKTKQQKEEEKEYQYQLKQQKRKQKHRGR